MKLAVLTCGFLPIPATKGGAVENLVVNLLNENEKNKEIEFVVFSIYDKDAVEQSKKYNQTSFKFIKVNPIVKFLDKITFFVAKNILKKKNSQSYRYIFQRLSYLNKVSKYLKKETYDKVLLENHPTQYLALKWRKNYIKYTGRYYYHCHNEFPGTYGCKDIISQTQKFICVSEYIKKTLENYLGLESDKFVVLRNCIDTNRFSEELSDEERLQIRKKYNITEDEKVLLFTGRIVPEKGVKELLQSLINLKNKNYKLLIVGGALNDFNVKTSYQQDVENIVKKLEKNVIFTGFVNYQEIAKFYKLADFAVIPSIWDDPAPLTIIESLVTGLPIITTNSGGIPEYATNGSAIIIKRDANLIDNLTQAIDKLLADDKLRIEMSNKGVEVSKDLTIENYYNNFVNDIK